MKPETDHDSNLSSLIGRVTSGDPRAVARAISKVEDSSDDASALMKEIFPHSRQRSRNRNYGRARRGQVFPG